MSTGIELDYLDQKASELLDGYLVRKDLVRTFSRQFPVPTYVVEFLLGRYCASTIQEEIDEGLDIVQRQLSSRTVKAGEEELFKARAREEGSVKLIDIITARLDTRSDSYMVRLPSLRLNDVRIDPRLVREHERMLTGGFYAEITLSYDAALAQVNKGRPIEVAALRGIQVSRRDVLDDLAKAREHFDTPDWKDLLLRSIGMEPTVLSDRQKDAFMLRMVPFVERNYNLVELGPRGTGKSHLFQQVSPLAHLVSGGKASVASMFVNNANGQRGLVCQYDVVCFDEVSGISFDQKDGVNIMKGYMESGEFSRGKESLRADGSIVMVGNFDVDVEHQQKVGHLFGPLPPEMRDDTAFMDRIHAYLPGWDVPKIKASLLTSHFGLVNDFLSACWSQLRQQSRVAVLRQRVRYGAALSGRDTNAVNKTASGLLKLLHPGDGPIPDEDIAWAVRVAMESRRRVKEQQKRIGAAEFGSTSFSYIMAGCSECFVATPEMGATSDVCAAPLEAGQVWTISAADNEPPVLCRVDAAAGHGTGLSLTGEAQVPAFADAVQLALRTIRELSDSLVGGRDPDDYAFTAGLHSKRADFSGAGTGLAALIALCSAMVGQSARKGLIVAGDLSCDGSLAPIADPVSLVKLAVESGARRVLMPISCRRALFAIADDIAVQLEISFYSSHRDAFLKALGD